MSGGSRYDIERADLLRTIERDIETLCAHEDRPPGSPACEAASAYFAERLLAHGFSVEQLAFECLEGMPGAAHLMIEQETFPLVAGVYTTAFEGSGELVAISERAQLEGRDLSGSILLLHGAVAQHQLAPRGYPFYRVPEDEALLDALEAAAPLAIVAATGSDPWSSGCVRPFPFIEDGSFSLPHACVDADHLDTLLAHRGAHADISIAGKVVHRRGTQVVSTIGPATGRRMVVCAHIDTKRGTRGALDNTTGVACLLTLAHLLSSTRPAVRVELVPFCGEDHYAAPGELAYLASAHGELSDVAIAINIDAAGHLDAGIAISSYGCDDSTNDTVDRLVARYDRLERGMEWPSSDHMVFAGRGVPAIAITSSDFETLLAHVIHGRADDPEIADSAAVLDAAYFIAELIDALETPGGMA